MTTWLLADRAALALPPPRRPVGIVWLAESQLNGSPLEREESHDGLFEPSPEHPLTSLASSLNADEPGASNLFEEAYQSLSPVRRGKLGDSNDQRSQARETQLRKRARR
jgi:hypothetical protein